MNIIVKFKDESNDVYLSSMSPVSFSADSTEALAYTLDLNSANIENDILEYIVKPVTAILKYDINIKVLVLIEEEGTGEILCKLMVSEVGVIKSTNPKVTDAYVNETFTKIQEVIAESAAMIYLRGAASGLSKTISSLSKAMGKGSGKLSVAGTKDVDKIIEVINNETKGHVVKPTVTLKDYVGGKILLEELNEVKDFMERYEDYKKLNIELPIGILFKGEPGTGKTYAAKCIAGSTDCYFISCTASSLQGMYIGSGSQNIRELFSGAKALQEASGKGVIIFIDEIDSLGSRENHRGGAGGEEDRTVNQLLAEMSGFEDTEKIMVMAATNYADRLDDALTRSGRFSRQINIPYPRLSEREYLVEYYFNRIDLKILDTTHNDIALLCHGLSPADIKEIANESAILAIRNKRDSITLEDINEAVNKCITKNVRNEDKDYTDIVTAHECGHVLAEYLYLGEVSIKVTNYSYGDAGGFTQPSFRLEGIIPDWKFVADVKTLLAGRAAEEVIMNVKTNGASNDLQKAANIITSYYDTYFFNNYKVSELEQLVNDKLEEVYNSVVEDFRKDENLEKLNKLIDELNSKRVLYKMEISAILEGGGSIL